MSMHFLREISQCEGHIYVANPIEVGWLMVYQSNGWIDAEFEQPLKTALRHHPPIHAVVHGLTIKGKEALKEAPAIDGPRDAISSDWLQLLPCVEKRTYAEIPAMVGA